MKVRRLSIIALLLIAIIGASAFLYWRLQPEPQPAQLVYGSGRIEADEVRIAPEIPGRLVEHRLREGEAVRAGELLARIDPVDFELQAGQASAQLTAARRSASQLDAQTHLARHHACQASAAAARKGAIVSGFAVHLVSGRGSRRRKCSRTMTLRTAAKKHQTEMNQKA